MLFKDPPLLTHPTLVDDILLQYVLNRQRQWSFPGDDKRSKMVLFFIFGWADLVFSSEYVEFDFPLRLLRGDFKVFTRRRN